MQLERTRREGLAGFLGAPLPMPSAWRGESCSSTGSFVVASVRADRNIEAPAPFHLTCTNRVESMAAEGRPCCVWIDGGDAASAWSVVVRIIRIIVSTVVSVVVASSSPVW